MDETVETNGQQEQVSEPASSYEVYQATEKMKYAWMQMVNSLESLSSRMEKLDTCMSHVMDDLNNCHARLQKRLFC